ncbi:condensation domain-containing protein [Lentzea sp. NPDC004782]|uniref:condensation domain-containing protein n=1 Tax=Lentzea sp. NPDC004782 TaxID=3154458 RepID=UPI0033A6BE40
MTVLRTAPASLGQRLLWFLGHYRDTGSNLNVPVFYRLRGELDADRLEAAATALVVRHEALRTTYGGGGRKLVQQVHAPEPVRLVRHRVHGPEHLDAALLEEAGKPFDLTVSPLRMVLFELAPRDHVLMINIHHLSTDGWSGGVLSEELGALYRQDAEQVPRKSWQPVDFSEWQRARFDGGELASHQKFWREQLAGACPPAWLEKIANPDPGETPTPKLLSFEFEDDVATALNALCRAQRTTIFTAGLALFASVLQARGGDNDFAIASMFANRSRPELLGTVGFLANMLVMRMRLPDAPTFTQVLDAGRDVVFEALDHQEVPYHLVPQSLGERSAGLENVMFQVTTGPSYGLRLGEVEVAQVTAPSGIGSRFHLEFALMPDGGRLGGLVWFDESRFSEDSIRQLVDDYLRLAQGVGADPDRPVAEHLAV